MNLRLKKIDFLWLLAFPLYQTIGTLRHEGSHALVAMLQGATIQEFVFWPQVTNGISYWGYVRWSGFTNWLTIAAPYFNDLVWFSIFYFIFTKVQIKRRWLWVNLVIIGLISPLVNSGYAYLRGVLGSPNDFTHLANTLPATIVHGYYLVTLAVYASLLYSLLRPQYSRLQH